MSRILAYLWVEAEYEDGTPMVGWASAYDPFGIVGDRNYAMPMVNADPAGWALFDEIQSVMEFLGEYTYRSGTNNLKGVLPKYDDEGTRYMFSVVFMKKERNPDATGVFDSYREVPWDPFTGVMKTAAAL
jgi:hypothetical protein